jgi:hypothetical protein
MNATILKNLSPGRSLRTVITGAVIAGLASQVSACGKRHFEVSSSTSAQKAPGTYIIPPRIDILLAQDNSGSMYESYAEIAREMPELLQALEFRGWDYHFATIPLATSSRGVNQVLASKHDPNWGSLWTGPYPGAPIEVSQAGMIASAFFATPETYSGFIEYGDIRTSTDGRENGFANILTALQNDVNGSNFLRDDAMLMVLVVGNSEDTSGVTFCDRYDGTIGNGNDQYIGPCEVVGYPSNGTGTSSFNSYVNSFKSIKGGDVNRLRFYSAVADRVSNDCRGGRSHIGTRYQNMAASLGGLAYDVCTDSIASILDDVQNELNIEKRNFRKKYLFIEQNAELSTIEVVKYKHNPATGTWAAETLPMSDTNGWTYAGWVDNVYEIDYPAELNLMSGWAIELHGSAKLEGEDSADVTFKPAGAVSATTE